jgi:UDP-3-O-[3-hydroxymyristoyl] glucosamine N-acyltransferase
MNKNLLIVGAGIYGVVAKEIAESMKCFEQISFVDDERKTTPNGIEVIGTTADLENLVADYSNIIVAIGNPKVRLSLINKIEEELPFATATLVSPLAYVAPSAQVLYGSIIEPMAVVHTGALISKGCIISAGAVVNHGSMCCDCCHIDCNATVEGHTVVPAGTKVCSGEVFKKTGIDVADLFMSADVEDKKPHGPIETETLKYNFDEVM